MHLSDAILETLLRADAPVVTDYGLYVLGQRLFDAKFFDGVPLTRLPGGWDILRHRNVLRRLSGRRAIALDQDFKSGVWRIVQSAGLGTPEDVACTADPFCYVSHLSAMQRYGLTDRSPRELHLTTPKRQLWNTLRLEKIQKELGYVPEAHRIILQRPGLHETIRRRPVSLHETLHPTPPVAVRGEKTRVTSIGQTFVDMLSQPQLCGGMHHVLEIWDREAKTWMERIIPAVEGSPEPIVKVRAGYILSERLGIADDRIQSWLGFAQRGGSRRLDAAAPYAPVFSEAWMLSLNV